MDCKECYYYIIRIHAATGDKLYPECILKQGIMEQEKVKCPKLLKTSKQRVVNV